MNPLKHFLLNIVNNPIRHYEINGKTVREEKLLSEGAFAFVWHVRDVKTNESYALKKILCQDNERMLMAQREIDILKLLPPHKNLIRFYGSSEEINGNNKEVLLLMELCDGGHLLDLLDREKGNLGENRIVTLFLEIINGLNCLHTMDPPVAHRDLKVENILLTSNGTLKICDFGSCSKKFIDTQTCTKEELLQERASIEQYTTMIYRAPEMIDLHRQYIINEKVDIWMMGCILFTLCFYKHPFQNLNNLAISNAKFEMPHNHNYTQKLTDLIIWMFSIEPSDRPSSTQLINILTNFKSLKDLPLTSKIAKKCKLYYENAQQNQLMMQKPYTPVDDSILKINKKKLEPPSKQTPDLKQISPRKTHRKTTAPTISQDPQLNKMKNFQASNKNVFGSPDFSQTDDSPFNNVTIDTIENISSDWAKFPNDEVTNNQTQIPWDPFLSDISFVNEPYNSNNSSELFQFKETETNHSLLSDDYLQDSFTIESPEDSKASKTSNDIENFLNEIFRDNSDSSPASYTSLQKSTDLSSQIEQPNILSDNYKHNENYNLPSLIFEYPNPNQSTLPTNSSLFYATNTNLSLNQTFTSIPPNENYNYHHQHASHIEDFNFFPTKHESMDESIAKLLDDAVDEAKSNLKNETQ